MSKLSTRRPLTSLTWRFITSYRKNTVALIFSLVLAVGLIFSMLTLLHTNHRITAKQNLFIYTAIDYELSGLSAEQVQQLEEIEGIQHLGVSQMFSKTIETPDHQEGRLWAANESDILAVSTLLSGRMPRNNQEVVAEKWALLNLGVNPLVGQSFSLPVRDSADSNETRPQTFTLVGIINDLTFNKRAGLVSMTTALDLSAVQDDSLIATVTFKGGNKQIDEIQSKLQLKDKQIQQNVWRENTDELLALDVQMGILLIVVCALVIYGIHRIALMVRKEHFGVLRALGLTERQVRRIILSELLLLFFVSLPLGVLLGWLFSYGVAYLSKDLENQIYFWGQADPFDLVIPVLPIVLCLIGLLGSVLLIGLIGSRKVNDGSITEIIFGEKDSSEKSLQIIHLKDKGKLLGISQQIGLKYVFRDIKTSLFVVLSLVMACTLFISLSYQAILAKENQQIRLTTNFHNSDYLMSTYNDQDTSFGIRQSTFEKIARLKNVTQIETQAALPVKVVDTGVTRNTEFFDSRNHYVQRDYGFSLTGQQQSDAVFHTKYKGYNHAALNQLRRYLVSGDFDPAGLKENEIIVAMPTTSQYGQSKGMTGFFKKGQTVMDYQIGDQLTIKYPSDLKTADDAYWQMSDTGSYTEKKLTIAAIAYYPYMPEVSLLEQAYPLLITSQENFQKVVPEPTFETINLTAAEGTTKQQQAQIEKELIALAVENQQVTARSMIEEKEQLHSIYRKEMVYVIGIAAVVLVLVVMNLSKTFKYRIETRKSELFLLKALGLTVAETKQMIIFENLIFGMTSAASAILLSLPVTRLQYQQAQIYLLGKSYEYPVVQTLVLVLLTLGFCIIISLLLAKDLHHSNILEELDKVE
ncbi:ABC transporter permease [Enterococcus sp. 669A]|uniref:ABC transporter permease n=1 Tax=Candidatus Enterococcus moelleringii TaxID=2815325 RepID=A0ABS3L596_9ENTE|nr:FtsX-like permease family protein [Enterococcus sp. 669A]MBO1304745.1 ABC transporter permease [Enterococcus sp. 669A]